MQEDAHCEKLLDKGLACSAINNWQDQGKTACSFLEKQQAEVMTSKTQNDQEAEEGGHSETGPALGEKKKHMSARTKDQHVTERKKVATDKKAQNHHKSLRLKAIDG